jgi:TonB family protein
MRKLGLAIGLFAMISTAAADEQPPANLDRAMISKAMSAVKPHVLACGKTETAKGQVKVRVEVAPDGKVKTVEVKAAPSEPLGACVAKAVKAATFDRTANGGSFTYPFVF